MQPVYRAASRPNATGKTFPTAQEALRYARRAAGHFRVCYSVYRVLEGKQTHLETFRPPRR